MEKEQFVEFISSKMKLIRVEYDFSQEKMANILGISKKTLVQIEKGRAVANWTTVVAFCALFNQSELLLSLLGDEPVYLAQMVAHRQEDNPKDRTLGGKVWWKEIDRKGMFQLQQNLISQHYRILDEEQYRWFSSFNEEEAVRRLKELAQDI